MKKIILKLLFFALVFMNTMFSINTKGYYGYAEENYSIDPLATITGTMSAKFSVDGVNFVTLTESSQISDWDYDKSGILNISLSNLDTDIVYKLVISMDNSIYLPVDVLPYPNGTEVDFVKNDSITVNGTNVYDGMPYSGTITYTFNSSTSKTTSIDNFELEFRYDDTFWDNIAGSSIGYSEDALLTIQLIAETDQLLDERNIDTINTGKTGQYFYGASFIYNSISADSFEGRASESLTYYVHQASQNHYDGAYFNKFSIEFTIPSYTSNGVTYYLQYNYNDIRIYIGSSLVLDKSLYEIIATEDKIIINLTDYYHTTDTILNLKMTFPQDAELLDNQSLYVFRGSAKAYINGNTTPLFTDTYKVTLNTTAESQLEYFSKNGTADYRNSTTVQPLGGLGLTNKGADSGRVKIVYDFDTNLTDNTSILVTTLRLMPDSVSKTFDLKYSLIDSEGNLIYFDSSGNVVPKDTPGATQYWTVTINNSYYNKTLKYHNSILFNRSALISAHQGYYFKTLEYTLGEIKSGATLWHSGANFSYTASNGTFWGHMIASGSGKSVTSNIKVYEEDNNNIFYEKINQDIITKSTKVDSVAYGMSGATVSTNLLEAGDSFSISGQVTVVAYPYTANNILNTVDNSVVLGFKLPEGVTINSSGTKFTNNTGTVDINIQSITSRSLGDGNNFWTIVLEGGYLIGYCSETLGATPNGSSLKYTVAFNTSLITSGTTLYVKDLTFVAAQNIVNGANGTYKDESTVDIYDLNGNGSKTDKVGCFGSSYNSLTIQIVGKDATLDIQDNISINGVLSDLEISEAQKYDDVINYELQINCTSGGKAKDFSYFIPIVKKNSIVDNQLIFNADFSFKLNEAVSVANSIEGSGVKVLYTFETDITYNTITNSSITWYDTIPSDKNVSDVTFVKIIPQDEAIENGSISIVSFSISYDGTNDDYSMDAGMINSWTSRGQYKFLIGDRGIGGHYSTGLNNLAIHYTFEQQVIELTTTTGDHSDDVGNDIFVLDTLKQFNNSQTYTITSVTTYNALLDSVSNMEAKASLLKGDDANRTFAFYVTLDTNAKADLSIDDIVLGNVASLTDYKLTFEIFNADIISDITTIRYVDIIIEGDNGVTIPVRINIKRELTIIGAVTNSISAGKQYTLLATSDTKITISKDSAFTAQFSAENIIPDNYKARKLVFNTPLPEGTSIILIDLTDTNNIKYYLYNTLSTETNEIDLTKFNVMGSKSKYMVSTGTTSITENYIFIIDFKDDNTLTDGFENTINLARTLNSNVDEMSLTNLSFITKNIREYELSGPSEVETGEQIEIQYSVSDLEYSDSKYNDRKLSLSITPISTVSISDSYITIEGKYYSMNSNNEFIIPLDNVQLNGTNTITFSYNSKTIEAIGATTSLNIKLIASATASAYLPHLGEVLKSINININTPEKVSLTIESMSNRWISKENLEDINLSYLCSNVNGRVTIELQKKIGEGYATDSTLLEAVNGNTNQVSGQFDVTNSRRLTLTFSDLITYGNYQILFTIYDESGYAIMSIPYRFIVVE